MDSEGFPKDADLFLPFTEKPLSFRFEPEEGEAHQAPNGVVVNSRFYEWAKQPDNTPSEVGLLVINGKGWAVASANDLKALGLQHKSLVHFDTKVVREGERAAARVPVVKVV